MVNCKRETWVAWLVPLTGHCLFFFFSSVECQGKGGREECEPKRKERRLVGFIIVNDDLIESNFVCVCVWGLWKSKLTVHLWCRCWWEWSFPSMHMLFLYSLRSHNFPTFSNSISNPSLLLFSFFFFSSFCLKIAYGIRVWFF